MKILAVGDIHAKVAEFSMLADMHRDVTVVQLGDFGFGFHDIGPTLRIPPNVLFLRGNHDSPQLARKHPAYLGEFGNFDNVTSSGNTSEFYFISGAYSVDFSRRTMGFDMWPDEELSEEQLDKAILDFRAVKPSIVFSHEAPGRVGERTIEYFKQRQMKMSSTLSRTAMAMELMFECHKPKLWVFGHYHLPYDQVVDGTRFVCLPELQTLKVETDEWK